MPAAGHAEPPGRRFFAVLLRRRALVAGAGLLLCAAALWSGRGVRSDYNVEQFFPVWDPERIVYERYKAAFTKEDAQFALFWREDGPLDAARYDAFRAAADVFEDAGLEDVRWFGNADLADNEAANGETLLRIHPLVESDAPTDTELREILAEHRDDPLYRNAFWNADQSVFALVGYLPRDQNHDEARRRVEARLSRKLAAFEAPGRRLALAGIPYMRARVLEILGGELPLLLGAAVLVLFAVMYAFLRSVAQVLLCLAAIVPAYLIVRGVMGVLDWPATVLTSFLPILVLAIGFSDTIHLLTHYRVVRDGGVGNREAIVRSFSELAGPCFYTSLTTAVGFLALASTRIEIVVDFAIVTALAMLLTYACAMLFFPVLLSFARTTPGAGAVRARWLDRLLALAGRVARGRAGAVLLAAALLLAGFGWLARGLHVNAFMFDALERNHPIMQDVHWIESQGFGLFRLNVFVEGSDEAPLHELPVLRWMERFQRYAESEPLVVRVGSFLDQLKQVRRAVLEGRPEAYRLPDSSVEAAQLLLLAESGDPTYLEDTYLQSTQQAQVVVVVQDRGSQPTLPFLARIDAWLAENPPPPGVRAHATGTVKLAQTTFDQMTAGFASSLALAIGLIFAIMAGMFRSLAWGAVALVPNLLPLVLLFGLFAAGGFAVKPSHVLVFAVAFGVAVDDAIHMLGVLRRLRAEGCPPQELVERALHSSGRAIAITTLVIGSGFAILLLSSFEWVSLLGLLIPFALCVALLANLFVLPALIHALRLGRA